MTTSHRRRGFLYVSLMCFCLVLTAEAVAKNYYKMSTLTPGSSPNLVMTTFADIIGKKLGDVEIRIRAEGAATRHAIDAARGETDFFLTSPIIQELMLGRKGMYEKVKGAPEMAQKLRSILMFDIGLYHITVYEESGIRTLMDIKDKKVFLGPPGGAALRVAKIFTKAATGYEPGKDFDVVKLGWEAAAAAFSDKRIDVYISPTIAPSPIIQKIAETNRIRFLTLEDTVFETEAVKALFRRPGRTRGFIDVGTYGKNQMNTEPVQSTGAIVGIATREGMPDDIIYRMTKAFWEGVREMRNSAPWLRSIDRSKALDHANIPLHPGALKYYREIGLTVPPRLVPE